MLPYLRVVFAHSKYASTVRVALAVFALSCALPPCSSRAVEATADNTGQNAFAPRFAQPAAEHRIIKIIHGWPDSPNAQDNLIRSLNSQGFGGVVCNVSFTDYLQSETKWNAFTRAINEARKAGFALWLYDEKGYPSAAAGGQVLKSHPEWEAKGLLIAEIEGTGAFDLALPPGRPVFAGAFPLRNGASTTVGMVDLTSRLSGTNVSWLSPAGQWRLVAVTEDTLYEGTHASMSLAEHLPYPNLLLRQPTSRFLELTHDAYARHLGQDLGKTFVATFTDEPSLMSLFLKRMPYRVLPWSSDLPSAFRRRHGRDLQALLPALIGESSSAGQRARYEFWDTVGEQVSQNFFGQIQEWCGRHNVLSGGHLLMEENLVPQVGLYGDFFRCLRRLDAPSIDCLTSVPDQVPWFIGKLAASAAALEQQTVVMCETSDHSQRYRPRGDNRPQVTVSTAEIRGTCNRLIAAGVNRITSYYSFAGLSDADLRELNTWVGRSCAAMSGGQAAAPIAVLYPIQSVWPRYKPGFHYANDSAAATRIENILQDVSQTLFANARDFTVVDERTLSDASVRNGAFSYANMKWNVVILPATDTLPLKAWENLARFVTNGGLLISVGNLPENSETEFPSQRVKTLATQMFDGGARSALKSQPGGGAGVFLAQSDVAFLPRLLDKALARTFTVPAGRMPLRYHHRRMEEQDVLFVINDSSEPFSGPVRASARTGEQWDPATGDRRTISTDVPISMNLQPYGASVLTLRGLQQPSIKPLTATDLPRLVTRSLPATTPTSARGEFVRETISDASAPAAGQGRRWRASGLITKGQTDTFLFLRFIYDQPPGLDSAESIVLDTAVPEGQRASAQLLLILHEKGGADYLAHTGRMLSASGDQQISMPLSRFQLAGWSKDSNNRLDLHEVNEIRVGWGGYYGVEGETVEFTSGAPQAGLIR